MEATLYFPLGRLLVGEMARRQRCRELAIAAQRCVLWARAYENRWHRIANQISRRLEHCSASARQMAIHGGALVVCGTGSCPDDTNVSARILLKLVACYDERMQDWIRQTKIVFARFHARALRKSMALARKRMIPDPQSPVYLAQSS
jgi:hypothetical protein